MYILNTSFAVECAVNSQWLDFARKTLIPHIKNCGFRLIAFSRVLSEEAPAEFVYSLLVEIGDIRHYEKYMEEVAAQYKDLLYIFCEKVLFFTSLMKKIELE